MEQLLLARFRKKLLKFPSYIVVRRETGLSYRQFTMLFCLKFIIFKKNLLLSKYYDIPCQSREEMKNNLFHYIFPIRIWIIQLLIDWRSNCCNPFEIKLSVETWLIKTYYLKWELLYSYNYFHCLNIYIYWINLNVFHVLLIL